MPLGLNGTQGRFSESLSYGQHYERHSVQASDQDEAASFEPAVLSKVSRFGSAFYKFLRPYGLIQASISAVCLFARVLVENPRLFKWSLLLKAFTGLIAIVLSRAYFIGINQIYDADIDRVNKPNLPIPSGDISVKQAWFFVIFDLLAGLSILRLMNADLITTSLYCLGLFFATFYSVPPIRFKRSSFATSIGLPLTTGVIHNVGILYATIASLGLQFSWSPSIVFIVTFATLFFVTVSIAKDLTDVEGDMKHNIRTFPAIFGPRNSAFFCTGLLLVKYIGAIVAAIYMPQKIRADRQSSFISSSKAFKRHILVPVHAVCALWLLSQTRKLDKENYSQEASANFNESLWKLLNLEFLLFPFI
ncbi:hypothetical protein TIFTF001_044561 [Ficus carica]|uniref:Uncharacterized protein n=1 Tax=Ficus carica TaxID=3494 RepID=A0AA88D9S2_FICCA|nr:hypothetical protein TIFTF001_044560 [Ficus carica]GMN31284.1 hypothetical protein TIFTF001_044561 [Ficus carica]